MAKYKNAELSKELLKNAFAELVYEKRDISKVSVKDIIEKSTVSKSTFYTHYNNIEDLVKEITEEFTKIFSLSLEKYIKETDGTNYMPYVNECIDHFKEKEKYYFMLTRINNIFYIYNDLKKSLVEIISKRDKIKFYIDDNDMTSLYLDYVLSGIVTVFYDYFSGFLKNTDLDEIAYFSQGVFTFNVVRKVIEK